MSDTIAEFNKLKQDVDKGKQTHAAAERELQVNTNLLTQARGEARDKFGCESTDELKAKVASLESEITQQVSDIRATIDCVSAL